MKNLRMKVNLLLLSSLGIVSPSQAWLSDLGNGLIYDDVLKIAWMKNANLFKTLCDANDPLATGFIPVVSANVNTICANNGAMLWDDAEAWIARLNTHNYLGYNDWRQPKTLQPDTSCETFVQGIYSSPAHWTGYNCRGSEMPHLFGGQFPGVSGGLANPNHQGTGTTVGPDGEFGTQGSECALYMVSNCLFNTGPFENLQASAYWSGTEFPTFASTAASAWIFSFYNGGQEGGFHKSSVPIYVFPVRDMPFLIPIAKPKKGNLIESWDQ